MNSLPLQLPDLVSEVDRLEKEVLHLTRDVQREEAQAALVDEFISKDQEKERKLQKEISDICQDTQEWECRERCLAGAIESSYKNLEFLRKMEAEGNTKLDQEVKKTDDLLKSLKLQVDGFQKKYDEDMEIIERLPGFDQKKEIEQKKEKLAKIEEENKKLMEELEENKKRKKSEWEHFQKSCLLLAGKGLEARESSREMEASKAVLKQSKSTSKKDNSLSAGAGALAMEIDEQVEVDDHDDNDEQDEVKNLNESGQDGYEDALESLTRNNSPASRESSTAQVSQTPVTTSQSDLVKASEASCLPSPAKLNLVSPPEEQEVPTAPPLYSLAQPLSPQSDLSPASTPKKSSATPKSRPSPLAVGSSILSSLRGKFRDRSDSPKREKKFKSPQASDASDSEEPRPPPPSSSQAPVQSPRLKKLKLGLPKFLFKKKTSQDPNKVQAEAEEVVEQSERSSTKNTKIQLSMPKPVPREEGLNRRSVDQIHTDEVIFKKPAPVTLPRPRKESSMTSLPRMSTLKKPSALEEVTIPVLPSTGSPLAPAPRRNLLTFLGPALKKNPVVHDVKAKDAPEKQVCTTSEADIDDSKSVSELATPQEFPASPDVGDDFFNSLDGDFQSQFKLFGDETEEEDDGFLSNFEENADFDLFAGEEERNVDFLTFDDGEQGEKEDGGGFDLF